MMYRIGAVLMLCLFWADASSAQQRRGTLYGWVVVIDPGHGGADPGSSRRHGNGEILEAPYVYDVALRVQRLIRERQGIAVTTVRDGRERNDSANRLLPPNRRAQFALDGTTVRAGSSGLEKRVAFGNSFSRRYPLHNQAWVSIHFDVVGKLTGVEGVRIIAAYPNSNFAFGLADAFGPRLRDVAPVVENGDDCCGIRNLYVLSSRNRIRNRVLVELGNFNNDRDAWRIRDPDVREEYARAIVRALEQM
jgi:N-acetylmuramoyl-L-alanine amidase